MLYAVSKLVIARAMGQPQAQRTHLAVGDSDKRWVMMLQRN